MDINPTDLEKKMYEHMKERLNAFQTFRRKYRSTRPIAAAETTAMSLVAQYEEKYHRVCWRNEHPLGIVGFFQGEVFTRIFPVPCGSFFVRSGSAKQWAEEHREAHTK